MFNARVPAPRLPLPGRLLLVACLAVAAAPPALGQAVAERVEFLRLSRDDAGRPVSLDTSIVSYAEPPAAARRAGRREPLQIDLVAVVHVGGRGYYETLNRLFTDYDSVLYELVAPPNARVPKPGRRPSGMIGSAQQGLTQMLGLDFQLERIDYSRPNLVHADLSPKEFDAAMARRGESWWTMFSRLMREGMARAERGEAGPAAEIGFGEMLGILFGAGPERQLKLRRLMAEQFSDMEVLTSAFGGEEGSTLITDRNAAAMKVLQERVAAGDRTIAIFYGAAHMDDFDRRLRDEFSAQPGDATWLEAWDLREPRKASAPAK